MSDQVYYKVLGADGVCCHGGSGRWNTDGSWMPAIHGGLSPCVRGYHVCRAEDLVEWLGPVIWTAEGRGKAFSSGPYRIFQEARVIRPVEGWSDAVAREFAVACAERAVPILEVALPGETRVVEALAKARERANGDTDAAAAQRMAAGAWSVSRLVDGAARDAAIAAYGAVSWLDGGMAAWAAAGSARSALAASAWESAMTEAKAQGIHPRDAERTANGVAAATLNAERTWQTALLFTLLKPPVGE
ncbi:MAG: hypothetical protein HQL99_12280 [Magnetococcales bacterium]|nr:hypothetical protein [Magnetococcales bacterium]